MMQAQPKIVPSPAPDQNKIQLKLRRSQKSGLLGKHIRIRVITLFDGDAITVFDGALAA